MYVEEHFNPGGVFVVGGQSPRFPDGKHAVVMEPSSDKTWKLVHDPHPDNTGIVGDPEDVTVIFPCDTSSIFFRSSAHASKHTHELRKAYKLAMPESLKSTTSTNEKTWACRLIRIRYHQDLRVMDSPVPPRGTRTITRPFRLEDLPRSKPLPDPMDLYNEEIEMILGCNASN